MNSTYLCHYGIKGQEWGVRRFQYKDGSLTEEGRKRYGVGNADWSRMTYDERASVIQNNSGIKDRKDANSVLLNETKKYMDSQTTFKKMVKDIVLGPGGHVTYDMAKATGDSAAKAFLKSFFDVNSASIIGAGADSLVYKSYNKIFGANEITKKIAPAPYKYNKGVSAVLGRIANYTASNITANMMAKGNTMSSLQQRHMATKLLAEIEAEQRN